MILSGPPNAILVDGKFVSDAGEGAILPPKFDETDDSDDGLLRSTSDMELEVHADSDVEFGL